MEVRSIYKYARISPKKARDVAREIQGLPVSDAIDTLNFTPKKAAFLIGKTLKSAVANAENNCDPPLDADNLFVKEANISEGPAFRRFKPRARGSASAIKKRTSHIYITLTDEVMVEEKPEPARKPKRKKKPAREESQPAAASSEEAPEETDEEIAAAGDDLESADATPEVAAEESTGAEAEEAAPDEDESKE